MAIDNYEWVESGTALEALEEMCRRPDVETAVFHRVYERVLGDPKLCEAEPGAVKFLEQLLHADGPYLLQLMHEGRIATVGAGEDLRVPDTEIPDEVGYDLRRRIAWVIEHRNLHEEFAREAAKDYNHYGW